MTKICCDVVLCSNNENFRCKLNEVNISLSHINDSNGNDYTVIIECQQNTRNNRKLDERQEQIDKFLKSGFERL